MQFSFPPILKNVDFVQYFVEKFAEFDAIVLQPSQKCLRMFLIVRMGVSGVCIRKAPKPYYVNRYSLILVSLI